MLHIWPAFPIAVQISDRYDELPDNVVAALEHTDRVCEIYADGISGDELEELTPVLYDSFPALTHLHIGAYEEPNLVPASFLGGSAPLLRSLYLKMSLGHSTSLPQLLSSAAGLVSLSLFDTLYIPSQMMVDLLTSLTRLEKLRIEYRFWIPEDYFAIQPSRHPRPLRRHIDLRLYPVLATFVFVGATEYFDSLFRRIDTPKLEDIKI
jgi:hypothetical protein